METAGLQVSRGRGLTMPELFTAAFAKSLDSISQIRVKVVVKIDVVSQAVGIER